jgi:hypothetical protein
MNRKSPDDAQPAVPQSANVRSFVPSVEKLSQCESETLTMRIS